MDNQNRPHSREKTTASGSASVGKGRKVSVGSGPVGGSQGRGSSPSGGGQQHRYSQGNTGSRNVVRGGKMGGIVLVVIALVVVYFLFGRGGSGGGGQSDNGGFLDYSASQPSQGSGNSSLDLYGNSGSGGQGSSNNSSQGSSSSSQPSAAADSTVSSLARAKRVTPVGGGSDEVTVMIYMCGTDLESKYGMATSDLQEMMRANIAENVNVIVFTGGCKAWKNNVMSSSVNQIYRVRSGSVDILEKDAGTAAMTDPANLTSFIKYCADKYPADRNFLILWDHGGGTITGYGYDEKNGRASMTLPKIDKALSDAGCVFDWIGFDACLMATLETDLVCEKYADYMIASEEAEPGTGWHYTGWLNTLSGNTSVSTVDLGKVIVDDFVSASCQASPRAQVTLSLVDLAELHGTVPEALNEFAKDTNELIESGEYKQISDARAGVRQFAQSSRINQVDLVDLAQRIGTEESNALAAAINGCVKYNRSTISRSNGVSIYFPYESLSSVKGAVSAYNSLGLDGEYTKCIQSFASLECGGQTASATSLFSQSSSSAMDGTDLLSSLLGGSSSSPLGSLFGSFMNSSGEVAAGSSLSSGSVLGLLEAFSGRSMPEEYSWVDTDLIASSAGSITGSLLDPGRITVTEKNGRKVLSLTEEEWKLIQTLELNIFVDDGEGYIDLGLDNTFGFDEDGDLIIDYDGTWLTLNGHTAAYYLVSDVLNDDGTWTTTGRIPALLNSQPVNLMVVFSSDAPAGTVTGAYPIYKEGETDAQAKGNIPIQDGDVIELLCDYYDYNGDWSDSYTLGEAFTVEGGLTLTNMRIDASVEVTYRLTDIYGTHYWTPTIKY